MTITEWNAEKLTEISRFQDIKNKFYLEWWRFRLSEVFYLENVRKHSYH